MERHEDVAARPSGDAEATISHFIPSVELTGSRDEKLRKLDILILHLQQVRRSLALDTSKEPARSRERARPAWGWLTAGIVIGAVFILLLFAAGRWAL